jgi:hypothetical protein
MLEQWSPWNGDPTEELVVTQEVRDAAIWWTQRHNVMVGVELRSEKPVFQVFTDASLQGWGGHMEERLVHGEWTEEEKRLHINVLELLAVWRVLESFVDRVRGKTVMVASDNTTTIAYIRKQGGTRSRSLLQVTQELYQWLVSEQIKIKCRHIPGRLNVLADSLSREGEIVATEWSVHPQVLEYIWQVWEKPMLDLMATRYNNKMPIYVSPIPDPKAFAVDALSIDWTGMYAYVFPPTAIVNKVLEKVKTESCTVVMIAPAWPKQRWYPDLLELLVDQPLQLPLRAKMLKQPRSAIYHHDPEIFQLHAWKLSKEPTLHEAFLRRLQEGWHEHRKGQAWQSTRASGSALVLGVVKGVPIRAKLLSS